MKSKLNFLFLFGIWAVVTFWAIMQYDKNFFSLTRTHSHTSVDNFSEDKIYRGNKISGSFVSEYNYLGTVSLNFTYSQRVAFKKEDTLTFKIKEKGASSWYFEAPYRSGIVFDTTFFPFGFPIIENSVGKTYEFELFSYKGNEENALALKRGYPTIESRYLIPRNETTGDLYSFFDFISNKILNKITTLEILFISIIAALPFVIYILWILFLYKHASAYALRHPKIIKLLKKIERTYDGMYSYIRESYYFILGVSLLIAVLLDIFLIHIRTNIIYLVILLMWIRSFRNNKHADLAAIFIALIMLMFCPIFLAANSYVSASKSTAWSLIFFFISVFYVISKKRFQKKT